MPKYDFSAQLSLRDLIPIWNSAAAHVAAKLQHFGSDERTLTDEVCDMFFIWSQLNASARQPSPYDALLQRLSPQPVELLLTKTTTHQEAATGNDLWLTVIDARGRLKRAAFQSKVVDPTTGQLRCATTEGWENLRTQLTKMKLSNGALSFLLTYVPMGYLDGSFHGFGTWEQGFAHCTSTGTNSRHGITAIPYHAMLDAAGDWIHPKRVEHVGAAQFLPQGISLTQLIAELLLCRRGAWDSVPESLIAQDEDRRPRTELALSFAGTDRGAWDEFVGSLEVAERSGLW